MSRFTYGDKENDMATCEKAIRYNLRLICGSDKVTEEKYLSEFLNKVQTFQTYNKGTTNNYVNSNQEGLTRLDDNGFLHIDVIGNGGQETDGKDKVLNHVVHECCHAFNHLLYLKNAQNIKGIIRDGVYYYPSMGLIGTKDAVTMKPVGQKFYGDMYRESLMDIMTNIALVSFDDNFKKSGVNADVVLTDPYYKRKVDSAMSQFNPLMQLMISAFSNNPNISYSKLINDGIGIYDCKVKKNNGTEMMANDFLYGIMCDPFHIESEFNRVMGEEPSYRMLTELLDSVYATGVLEANLPEPNKKAIRFAIEKISEFLNKKCEINVNNGTYTQDEANRLISKYNTIYNEVIKIYGSREQKNMMKTTNVDRSSIESNQEQDTHNVGNVEGRIPKKEKWYKKIINKIKGILKKDKMEMLPASRIENISENNFKESIRVDSSKLQNNMKTKRAQSNRTPTKDDEHYL